MGINIRPTDNGICLLKPWEGKRTKCHFCRRRAWYVSPAITNNDGERLMMCDSCMMAFDVGFRNGEKYVLMKQYKEGKS